MKLAITQNTQDLEQLEGIIRKGQQTFYEVGRALMEIRDRGLYRDVKGYDTFEAYCRAEWDISRPRAYQLIDAAEIKNNLSTIVDTVPTTESQARPLARLEPDKQREVWQMAVETAPEGKVTAAHVSKVAAGMSEEVRQKKVYKIKNAINQVQGVHPDFEKAYRAFYREVQSANLEGWKETNKGEALKLISNLIDLITLT